MTGFQDFASDLAFPEGPVALADGSLLVVEIRGQCLTRLAADGSRSVVASLPGGPNGAAMGPDGAIYVCNNGGFEFVDVDAYAINIPVGPAAAYSGGSIQRVDPEGRSSDRRRDDALHPSRWCRAARAERSGVR